MNPSPPILTVADEVQIELILNDAFWNRQLKEMRPVLLAIMQDAALTGVEVGTIQLADGGVMTVDAPLVTTEAIRYAAQVTDDILAAVSKTNRTGVGQIVSNWITSGEALPKLAAQLRHFGNVSAQAIATTEVTRAFSAGQRITWDKSGMVEARRWWTVTDEKVCSICNALHNTVVPLYDRFTRLDTDADGNPIAEGETVGSLVQAAGFELNPFGDPPAHTNCRCLILPVVIGFGLVLPSRLVIEMVERFNGAKVAA